MLVLSRHQDESIMIGDIEVMVVGIRGNKVRLAIKAPRSVPVHRKEVYQAIHRSDVARTDAADGLALATEGS